MKISTLAKSSAASQATVPFHNQSNGMNNTTAHHEQLTNETQQPLHFDKQLKDKLTYDWKQIYRKEN